MAKLSFKIYLVNENESDSWTEVRRFSVDADVATNFVYLREKLQTIFPDLRSKNFTITWKDDENETITISTNEELIIALDEMAKNDIYKLYVVLQLERDSIDISKIEKILHPGVVCDVCDKGIHGFRFKCMQCRDYDLCTDCMTLGNHSQHYMIRMTQPIEWSSHLGRQLAHHMRKFMKKAAHDCKEDERRGCSFENKRTGCPVFSRDGPKFGPHSKFGPVPKFVPDPSVINCPLKNFMIDVCAGPLDENQEQKRTKEQNREPSAEAATEATENPWQEATRHSISQLLKTFEHNIFNNMSQFLDPLGINMMADNESAKNKPANGAQTKTDTEKPEARPSTSSEDSAKKFPGEGKKLRDDPVNTAAAPSTDNVSSQKNLAAAIAATAAAATVAAATAATVAATTSTEQAAEAEEWTMIQRESPIISRTSSVSSSNGNMHKQGTPSAPMAEPEKTPSNQRIYPPLPEEVRHEFYHPNPKIQRAVEAMMAMGFSNEGSWLTHLLVAQNGDIDKALDVIHPVRRH